MCMICSQAQAKFVEIMHLANSTSSLNLPPVESGDSAGAPEMEITPPMIEAGAKALVAKLWTYEIGPTLALEVSEAVLVSSFSKHRARKLATGHEDS